MDPRKSNARRGFKEREEIRRKNASQWQPEFSNTQKEGEKMNENWKSITIVGLVCLTVLCLGACIISSYAGNIFSRPATVTKAPTAEVPVVNEPVVNEPVIEAPPVVVETEAPPVVVETEAPPVVVETEAPPVVVETEAPAPVIVSCDTPSIQALVTLNGKSMSATGEFLDTNLGKRVTYTSRRLLIPDKAWNVELTADELNTVETTWQSVQVCIPNEMFGRIFASGFEQGINRYENGVLMTLQPGVYEFKLRNGEIVLWYPQQEEFASKDLERIVEQIKFGNFDIHSELAFFGVTADILPKLDQALVKERNVQLVVAPDPMVIK